MTCGYRNCQSRACGSTIRPDGHELAYCVAHEAIARHLPPLRSAACCTSEGCGRPQGSRSPLCKSCRPRYAAWGLDGYPVPQEAPMTEPTSAAPPKPVTPAWSGMDDFGGSDDPRDLMPPAAPQDAADGGAIPSVHPLEARRDRLVATLLGAGFEEKPAISGRVRRFAYCNDFWVIVPNGPAAESQEDFARALDTAEAALRRLTSTADAPHLPVAPAPAEDAARWRPMTAAEVEAALDTIMPLDVPAETAPKPACTAIDGEPCACFAREGDCPHMPGTVDYTVGILDRATAPGTDGESDGEPSAADVDDAYSGRWGQYTVGIDPATGKEHTAAYVVELVRPSDHPTTDGLLSAILGPRQDAPTLAEVQAELERERERADRAELDAVQERERADEAKAELAAIAALLDPEDSPAFDANDQPIPLPVRVQTALMPDPIGKSELERRITKALDRYDAPKGFGSLGQASPYGRVLLTARENKQLKADKAALQGIIDDTEWIVHHCGSYGATASLADRVLRLLPVERQRAILELKRSEAYIEVARINARFLNPPPPGRLEECVAEVAEIEAKIAALDAGEVRE